MKRKPLIAVVGHGIHAEEIHMKTAEEVGREIAKKDWIMICGGRKEGIMDAVSRGVKKEGGTSIGILPRADNSDTSEYIDIPILTGIGFARNQIIAFSCDAMIVVGGGVGTLTEVSYAYRYSKPIVVITGIGGLATQFIGKYMDEKKKVKINGAKDAKEAVELVSKLIEK